MSAGGALGPYSPRPGCGSSAGPSLSSRIGPRRYPRGTACAREHPPESLAVLGPSLPHCSLPSPAHTGRGHLPHCLRTGKPRAGGAAALRLPGPPKLPWPEQPRAGEDTEVGPRGRSTPLLVGKSRCRAGYPWAKLLISAPPPPSVCKPRVWCLQTGGRGTGTAGVSQAYLRVSLRAARSRGSSVIAFWGFSEILAAAARLSWRSACCTSGFRASSNRVISRG